MGLWLLATNLNLKGLGATIEKALILPTGLIIAVINCAEAKVFHVETAKYSDIARRCRFGSGFLS
jgi:hypothetical protein